MSSGNSKGTKGDPQSPESMDTTAAVASSGDTHDSTTNSGHHVSGTSAGLDGGDMDHTVSGSAAKQGERSHSGVGPAQGFTAVQMQILGQLLGTAMAHGNGTKPVDHNTATATRRVVGQQLQAPPPHQPAH